LSRNEGALQFIDVRFQVSSEVVGDLQSFYADRLGFESLEIGGGDVLALAVGSATARFSEAAASRSPFYHFALLVPGNRFDAAYEWLGARTQLLPDPDTGDRIFEFDNWSALACYCLDPAGNIVELIAHRGISESPIEGAFSAGEVVEFPTRSGVSPSWSSKWIWGFGMEKLRIPIASSSLENERER
jgi:catechol-2,3-dioxygenase